MNQNHKICVCIHNNELAAIKILFNSLRIAGYKTSDIVFLETGCSRNSIGYDSMFQVPKISCKSLDEFERYKHDHPLLDEYGDVPIYVFITENVEFTANTRTLITDYLNSSSELIYQHAPAFIRISTIIKDMIVHDANMDIGAVTKDLDLLRIDVDITGFNNKFNVYLIRDFNIMVYMRS